VETAEEGCLSIPEIYGDVERRAHIVVEALDRDGQPYRTAVAGYKARAIQHEIDHLDGILFLDHLSAVKRGLLLAKWKKSRKGKSGYLKEVTPEPAASSECASHSLVLLISQCLHCVPWWVKASTSSPL